MRLLADENIPRVVVEALRAGGHDVVWVRVEAPGATDLEVARRAAREDRVLLTQDKEFGEIAFRRGLPAGSGVILLRLPQTTPERLARTVASTLAGRADWPGRFSVVDEHHVRMVPLPRKHPR
ncbi:MAG: DUF5615 family PIN-like protein [Acidobacteria bacterium]|nr:DUF5615 family PIN-like protein [Acidobacteriota bacterium]